jgi:hypothetical protein
MAYNIRQTSNTMIIEMNIAIELNVKLPGNFVSGLPGPKFFSEL